MTSDDRTSAGQRDGDRPAVDVGEAARRLNVTHDAIRARLRRGTLQGEKRGNAWYVYLPDDAGNATQQATDATRGTGGGASRDATGAALIDLIADLSRRNAELAGAAAAWQARAGHLEERLKELTAGTVVTQEGPSGPPGSPRTNDTPDHGSGHAGHGHDDDATATSTWSRFVQWLRGS